MMLKSSQIPILLACEAKYSLFGDLHMTAWYDGMNNASHGNTCPNMACNRKGELKSWKFVNFRTSRLSHTNNSGRLGASIYWLPRVTRKQAENRKFSLHSVAQCSTLFSWFSGCNKQKRFVAKFLLKISLERWESTLRGFLKLIKSSYVPFALAFWRILWNYLVAMFSALLVFQDGWTQIILVQFAGRKCASETWSLLFHSLKTSLASSKYAAISFNKVALKQWSWSNLGHTPVSAHLHPWPARTRDVN